MKGNHDEKFISQKSHFLNARSHCCQKTVRVTRSALNTSLSPKKAAIAHSNLCAAYAKLEMFDEASQACSAALELRPDYEAAVTNKASLTIRLAQK